jgi:hypothetical protein
MFKLLITVTKAVYGISGAGCAIHSSVADFATREAAEIAIINIKKAQSNEKGNFNYEVIRLYSI